MSQNPKSPTPEKWMEYLQGKLPEPESLEIESYIKTTPFYNTKNSRPI